MFDQASTFNHNIGNWNTSSVINMEGMFRKAITFNQNIGGWNTSNVNYMSYMFNEASGFNQDLSGWCVTKITSEPTDFSLYSSLIESYKPIWGACP